MNTPYGLTHGPYLESILPEWVHVSTPDTLIVRECWRRYHDGAFTSQVDRATAKETIRWLLRQHHAHQQLCAEFRL
jgi:hypothetical protein